MLKGRKKKNCVFGKTMENIRNGELIAFLDIQLKKKKND